MRKIFPLVLAAGLGSGCLYTNIHRPRAYRSSAPSDVKTTPSDPVVSGEGCQYAVLYLVAWGDSGYAKAVRVALKDHPDGVLYDVRSDLKVRSFVLGLYNQACTVVTGKVGKL